MRPTEQQHRKALAGHADRLARFLTGDLHADSWRPIRLSYGLYYSSTTRATCSASRSPGGC